jgi:integrase
MREQRGYVFHQGKSWFVRYCDSVLQSDGSIKRVQVCKKLEIPYCDQYRTKASVRPFVEEILRPINNGMVNPQSTMSIAEFMEKIHLPKLREKKRCSTMKGYQDIWEIHLKGRTSKMNLREFRTVHGEQILADIARQDMDRRTKQPLSHNSLARIKSFLSGTFKQAKRLGILDGINPMMDVSTPDGTEAQETHAYSLEQIKKILEMLSEPAYTVVLTAALSGLRKGEIMGLRWEDFAGMQLSVRRSIWKNAVNEPKTKYSKAPIPVVKVLDTALNAHREKMGKLAVGYIFQSGNGSPLNLDNLARRVIIPAIEKCWVCRKSKREHKTEGHMFSLDPILQWHGWHAFRRGLATNLHRLGVDDKTIQAILRHSNVSLTMNVYVKSVSESQVSAMDALSEKLETCNDLAINQTGRLN